MTLSRILLGRIRPRAVINSQWRGKLLAGGTFLKGLLSSRRDAPTYQWYPNNFDVQRNKINCSGSGPVATVGHGARGACPAEMGARIAETAETRTCHTGGGVEGTAKLRPVACSWGPGLQFSTGTLDRVRPAASGTIHPVSISQASQSPTSDSRHTVGCRSSSLAIPRANISNNHTTGTS